MKTFLQAAIAAAKASAEVIRHYYHGDFAVELKSDQTPVTVADREAENIIREVLLDAFPAHGFQHPPIRLMADEIEAPVGVLVLLLQGIEQTRHPLDAEGLDGAALLLEEAEPRNDDLVIAGRARFHRVALDPSLARMPRRNHGGRGAIAPQHG